MTIEPPGIKNETVGEDRAPAQRGYAGRLLGIALVLFVFALCVNPTPESDLFWQLRTGDWILLHHRAPHTDMYSWTRFGTPWVAHEWLSFVIFSAAYRAAGFGGLYIYTCVVLAVVFGAHYRGISRRTSSPMLAFAISAAAAVLCSPFFQPRPQLATYLFSVLTLMCLQSARDSIEADRWDRRKWIKLAMLVPLFVLWANLHAGVLVGVAVLAVFTAGESITEYRQRRTAIADARTSPRLSRLLGGLTLACVAATLVTPYSYHEYENFGATISNSTMLNIVAEWASPDFHQAYGKELEILLIAIGYGMFFTRIRRRLPESILLVVLIHEALAANRNVPLLALLGTLVAAPHIHSALARHLGQNEDIEEAHVIGANPPSTLSLLASVAVVFFGLAQAAGAVREFGPKHGAILDRIGRTVVVYGTYPVSACAFIERERFPNTMRMYNIYGDGGFLIWRLPEHPVFIDSRADVYFGSMLEDYRRLNALQFGWRDILAAHGADMIVASASDRQVQQFLPAPDWALVYAGNGDLSKDASAEGRNNTLIFIKREPRYADLIAKCRRDCPAFASNALRKYAKFASLR